MQNKGYLAIDGDCAIQSIRHRKGIKHYEWNELIQEIAQEIDILSLFGNKFVISHIVLPEDLEKYIELFKSRNLKYKLVLLKPELENAIERCQMRTCHENITPKKWIKHFHDTLVFVGDEFVTIDNTCLTEDETVDIILNLPLR